jgi:NTP pyrophosphatase (non-canonical NTP hydrolase)
MIDYTRGNDWAYIQKINKEVADKLFPDRTTQSMFLKMYGELAELIDNPASPDELADVMIMLLDHAERNGINAAHAVMVKLGTNLGRKWKVNSMGVAQHV